MRQARNGRLDILFLHGEKVILEIAAPTYLHIYLLWALVILVSLFLHNPFTAVGREILRGDEK
jgi:hypothetical protein